MEFQEFKTFFLGIFGRVDSLGVTETSTSKNSTIFNTSQNCEVYVQSETMVAFRFSQSDNFPQSDK